MNTSNRTLWIIGGVAVVVICCVGLLVGLAVVSLLYPTITRVSSTQTAGLPGAAVTALPSSASQSASSGESPSLGPANAPVTIVEYSDFECPYCKRFRDETLDTIMSQYNGRVRLVFRNFPLTSIHPQAFNAAMAAECAYEQGKFWEMHDLLFANQDQLGATLYKRLASQLNLDQQTFNECYDQGRYGNVINRDLSDGQSAGVQGTPTFFINNKMVEGAQPFDAFAAAIDQALGK